MENEIIVLVIFGYLLLGWLIWAVLALQDYFLHDWVDDDLVLFMPILTFLWIPAIFYSIYLWLLNMWYPRLVRRLKR